MPDPKSPRFIQTWLADAEAERDAARAALAATPASVAPKFFYDRLGSHLFEAITELRRVLPDAHRGGDLRRATAPTWRRRSAPAWRWSTSAPATAPRRRACSRCSSRRATSRSTSRSSSCATRCASCSASTRRSRIAGLGQDFSTALDIPAELLGDDRPVFFYPGSSIGNFTPDEALAFLRRVRAARRRRRPADRRRPGQAARRPRGGLRRRARRHRGLQPQRAAPPQPPDRQRLRAAPVAPRRLLRRGEVAHRDAPRGARRRSTVAWPGGGRRFAAGERIHTENSCKYTARRLRRRCWSRPASTRRAAGPIRRGWFAVFWAPAR